MQHEVQESGSQDVYDNVCNTSSANNEAWNEGIKREDFSTEDSLERGIGLGQKTEEGIMTINVSPTFDLLNFTFGKMVPI